MIKVHQEHEEQNTSVFSITSHIHAAHIHNVYLFNEIQDPSMYAPIMDLLMNASDGDVVFFHVNSRGGNYYTCLQLQNAIATTQAHTVAIIHGLAASAGSAIALTCDDVDVMPFAEIMIHNAEYSFGGRAYENLEYVAFQAKQFRKWLDFTYEGFLTAEEIDLVEKGKQVYLNADEVIEKLQNREDYREKLLEEQEAKEKELEEVKQTAPKPKRKPKKTIDTGTEF